MHPKRLLALLLSSLLLALIFAQPALAVPAFASQTGETCAACHIGLNQLNAHGREFKLSGFTLGTTQLFPLSLLATASNSHLGNTQGQTDQYPKADQTVFEDVSLIAAGKANDHVGFYSKWTYDNLAWSPNLNQFHGGIGINNTDLRLSDHYRSDSLDVVYGLSLNNNPSFQDPWNSTPANSYPYRSPNLVYNWGYNQGSYVLPTPIIDNTLSLEVAGLTAYARLNQHWYMELGSYSAGTGKFSVFATGQPILTRLSGSNPYWRLAYSDERGPHSLALGLIGLVAHVNSSAGNPSSPTDRYEDLGADAQYQYQNEPHAFTTQLSWLQERMRWDPVHQNVLQDHDSDSSTLTRFKGSSSYWYQQRYGLTLGYFDIHGSTDQAYYSNNFWNSNAGNPDTRGYSIELDYRPQRHWLIGLQYTGYLTYMGSSSNVDGNGRNARDNNLTYLYTQLIF